MAPKEPNRSDYSSYLIHFTKKIEDNPASKNLLKILEERRIMATFNQFWVKPEQPEIKAVCLTEVPFLQLKDFISHKNDCTDSYKLSEYGIAFRKDFIRSKKGNPCLYLMEKNMMPFNQSKGQMQNIYLGLLTRIQ